MTKSFDSGSSNDSGIAPYAISHNALVQESLPQPSLIEELSSNHISYGSEKMVVPKTQPANAPSLDNLSESFFTISKSAEAVDSGKSTWTRLKNEINTHPVASGIAVGSIALAAVIISRGRTNLARLGMKTDAVAQKTSDSMVRIFGKRLDADGKIVSAYQGSGFIISKNGRIATAAHAVEKSAMTLESLVGVDRISFEIITAGSKRYTAKVLGADIQNDLALLKLNANPGEVFKPLKFERELPVVGRFRYRVGGPTHQPIGFDYFPKQSTYTSGFPVNSGTALKIEPSNYRYSVYLDRNLPQHELFKPGSVKHVFSDLGAKADLSGFSGGPVLNDRGRVMGIFSGSNSDLNWLFASTTRDMLKLIRRVNAHAI